MIQSITVPKIATHLGIVISMPYNDHNPAHIHVWASGHEAKVRISDSEMIEGHLPPKTFKKLRDWIKNHQDPLAKNWRLIRAKKPPQYISDSQ